MNSTNLLLRLNATLTPGRKVPPTAHASQQKWLNGRSAAPGRHASFFYSTVFCLFLCLYAAPSQAAVPSLKAEGDTVLVPLNNVFTEFFDQEVAKAKPQKSATSSKKVYQVEGYLVEAEGKSFKQVVLRDAQGHSLKMFWMPDGRKAGQGLLARGLIAKKLRVSYKPVSCYLPKEGKYITHLRITGVQIAK